MNSEEYIKNLNRLKEIEAEVRNPESSLDKIDDLIEETKKLAASCYEYTRGLKSKVEKLDDVSSGK